MKTIQTITSICRDFLRQIHIANHICLERVSELNYKGLTLLSVGYWWTLLLDFQFWNLQSIFFADTEEYCGSGVLLSDDIVLSNNNCYGLAPSQLIVKAGKHNINIAEDTEQRWARKRERLDWKIWIFQSVITASICEWKQTKIF